MEEDSSLLGPQVSRDHLKGLGFSCLESLCQEHCVTGQLQCYGKEEPWLPLGHGLSPKAQVKALSQQGGLGWSPYPRLFCFSCSEQFPHPFPSPLPPFPTPLTALCQTLFSRLQVSKHWLI